MTSIPASRRAVAMTLAPRSWPSSPTLATRTRMGRSTPEPPVLLGSDGLLSGMQFGYGAKVQNARDMPGAGGAAVGEDEGMTRKVGASTRWQGLTASRARA